MIIIDLQPHSFALALDRLGDSAELASPQLSHWSKYRFYSVISLRRSSIVCSPPLL